MQIKGDTSKITLTCSAAVTIDVVVTGFVLVDGATVPESGFSTPANLNTVTETAILSGVSDTKVQVVTYAQVTNVHASSTVDVTCLLYNDGATISARQFKVTLLPGESITFDGHKWIHNASNYGTFTPMVVALSGDQSNSTTTPTEVTGLSVVNVQPGTYVFNYYIMYQSAATTTGVKFDVNFTGTVTKIVWNQMWVDTSATASTAAADQDAVGAAGQVYGAMASRAKGTAGRGTTISVDTANADMLMRIEGIMIVTVAGDLELWHGSEVAAASTILARSSLILHKTA